MVAGYEVIAKLHESSRSLVYRGQSDDQRSSILKVMQAEYPSLEELGRYRLEYEIINRLNLAGVAQAYGLEPYQNGLVLVLEDFGGGVFAALDAGSAVSTYRVFRNGDRHHRNSQPGARCQHHSQRH